MREAHGVEVQVFVRVQAKPKLHAFPSMQGEAGHYLGVLSVFGDVLPTEVSGQTLELVELALVKLEQSDT